MNWIKQRATTILLFSYGLAIGTSTPLLLARCTSSGSCGNCGVYCVLGLGVLPLVLFITVKSRIRHAGQFLLRAIYKKAKPQSTKSNQYLK